MFFVMINNGTCYSVLTSVQCVWDISLVMHPVYYLKIICINNLLRSLPILDSPGEPACISRLCLELSPCFCNLLWASISLVDNMCSSSDPDSFHLSSNRLLTLMYPLWCWWQRLHFVLFFGIYTFLLLSSFKLIENLSCLFCGKIFISLHNMVMACLKGIIQCRDELWSGKSWGTPVYATIFLSFTPFSVSVRSPFYLFKFSV